jgi:hypothetical protein
MAMKLPWSIALGPTDELFRMEEYPIKEMLVDIIGECVLST